MRRILGILLLVPFVLAACGGAPADVSVAQPPQAQPIEQIEGEQARQIVDGWRASVPEALTARQIKPETIQQNVYRSEASLQEVADYYNQLTTSEGGWVVAKRMPGLLASEGVLVTGYESGGITTLVVGALDAAQFGGQGVIVYTATGNR